MKDVNIYLGNGIKGPQARDGDVIYILEYITAKGPVTRTEVIEVEKISCHRAELFVLSKALERLKEKCNLNIYTESSYLTMGFPDWVEKWTENGWRNSHGTEVKNRDLWQQLTELLTGNKYEFHIKETHSYSAWIQSELERRKKNV